MGALQGISGGCLEERGEQIEVLGPQSQGAEHSSTWAVRKFCPL